MKKRIISRLDFNSPTFRIWILIKIRNISIVANFGHIWWRNLLLKEIFPSHVGKPSMLPYVIHPYIIMDGYHL